MFEMITAIALWCGQPVYRGQIGYTEISKVQVQECRDRLLKCLTSNSQKCFENERLK